MVEQQMLKNLAIKLSPAQKKVLCAEIFKESSESDLLILAYELEKAMKEVSE